MKLIAAAALVAGMTVAGAASAGTVFFEGFDGYSPSTIAHDATGGTSGNPFVPAATSTTGNSISTDYAYRVPGMGNTQGDANSMYDQGTWTIATNPFAVHNLWVDMPTNTDPMLILNGATTTGQGGTPAVAYESGNINVGPGLYSFSYDQLNVCCNANGPPNTPSLLQLWYTAPDGSQTLITLATDSTPTNNGWETVSGTFNISAPGGTIRVGLVDNTTIASGNDFGVDNIRISAAPEPASWALMIGGFGLAGAMLRRRRLALAA